MAVKKVSKGFIYLLISSIILVIGAIIAYVYLCEKYEVSRTKLNSEKAIKEFAAGKNIEFVGI
jgi:zinc transporter ZupT